MWNPQEHQKNDEELGFSYPKTDFKWPNASTFLGEIWMSTSGNPVSPDCFWTYRSILKTRKADHFLTSTVVLDFGVPTWLFNICAKMVVYPSPVWHTGDIFVLSLGFRNAINNDKQLFARAGDFLKSLVLQRFSRSSPFFRKRASIPHHIRVLQVTNPSLSSFVTWLSHQFQKCFLSSNFKSQSYVAFFLMIRNLWINAHTCLYTHTYTYTHVRISIN